MLIIYHSYKFKLPQYKRLALIAIAIQVYERSNSVTSGLISTLLCVLINLCNSDDSSM
jgi:hypothetical protein